MTKTKKSSISAKKQAKRVFFSYSEENMQKAVEAVRENGFSKKQAAQQFGVPRSTLIRKLSGAVPLQRKMGPQTELSETEENTLVTWILAMAKKGFPVHKQNLLLSVKKFLEDSGKETRYLKKSEIPGRSWFEGFLKRHPEIKEKRAESVSKARAAVTQDRIYGWFDEISDYFKEKNLESILLDPSRIFNGDESGFALCPKSGKVLGPTKITEDFYERVNSEKELITVMATFAANGTVVPPMIIFPYKKMPKAIVESVPENWALGKSDSGWINSEVFYEYISNHFIPFVKASKIVRPVVLFVDGHRSHLTQQTSLFCDENGVILVSLFPNTTHIMQPADVAVFKPLKSGWKSAVRNWKFQNFPKEVNRYTFGSILREVFDQFATTTTIQNGFRKSGLFPFDRKNVDYTKCIPNRTITKTSGNVQNDHTTNNRALEILEEKIEKEELNKFWQTYSAGAEWIGNIESVNLYKVWCAINNDNIATSTQDMNLGSQESDAENTFFTEENSFSTVTVDNLEPYKTGDVSPLREQPATSSQWKTPENTSKKYYESKEEEGYKIPTPFKKCLIFPNSNLSEMKTPKRKRKIFPAVVSSGKYREYYESEQNKKLPLKIKKKKEPSPAIESSDSDVSIRYNDEDIDVSDFEDLDLTVGKYVIFKYENNRYPVVYAVQSGNGMTGNSLSESSSRGPHFDTAASKNVTALLGKTAYLNCRVKNLANRTVSWVRHRDVHLLTVGRYTYTSDQRFRAIHQPHSEDWTLQIKYPQHRDSGVYECQVSSTPHLSHFIHLTVIEPDTEIVGGPELFIDRGSTINLTCVVRHSPEPPAYIFWNHNDAIISYSSTRGGVSVATERGETSRSVLLIQKARPSDSGSYQCNPSNARTANVTVHVLNGEHPEAMQHGGNQRMGPSLGALAFISYVLLVYC